MQKINFQNLPSTTTPINATNLNAIQTNVENVFNGSETMGNIVVDSIRSKNIFNKNMFVSGLNINSSGTYISESSSGAGISYIKVEAGKTYTITSNVNRAWYYNFSTSIPTLNGTGTARTGESGTARTFTVPSGYTYFCLRSYPSNNEDNINQNIQLEKGSTATSYTPYQNLDGGIIQSGSNSNGHYIKFSDGTLMQWNKFNVTDQAISSAYGQLYQGTRNITFPIAFVGELPAVQCSEFQWGSSASWGGTVGNGTTLTGSSIRGFDFYSRAVGTRCDISWIAIGRWK